MMTIETAVAVEENLFERIEALSHTLAISPSRLFVLAVQEFIAKYENHQLLQAINAAYDDLPEQQEHYVQMRDRQRSLVQGQW